MRDQTGLYTQARPPAAPQKPQGYTTPPHPTPPTHTHPGRTRRLGRMIASQICLSAAGSANSLLCTLLATVVKKRMAFIARLSWPGRCVTCMNIQAACEQHVCHLQCGTAEACKAQ